MISAFARASQVLSEPSYAQTAADAAQFLQSELYDSRNHTLPEVIQARHGQGHRDYSDYAFAIQALIDLYEATFEPRWLAWATELQNTQDSLFWDSREATSIPLGEIQPYCCG